MDISTTLYSKIYKPESKGFGPISTAENLDTVHGMIVIFVVNDHSFFQRDFLGGVTYVDHAEQVIRDVEVFDRCERTLIRLAPFPRYRKYVHAVPKNVVDSVKQ